MPINTVIFSSRATIGEVCINKVPTATNQGYKNFVCDASRLNYEYLYQILVFLRPVLIDLVPSGSKYKEINAGTISNFEIPLPPLNIQTDIAFECNTVDDSEETAKKDIETLVGDINNQIALIYGSPAPMLEIDKIATSVQYGLNESMNEAGIGYKVFRMNEIIRGRMADNGSMKYADISNEEFEKYKLTKGDLLFNRTNSIEHVGKTGLFNLDGDYCFASYLVRVVPNTKKILPEFLEKMMNSAIFQAEAKGKASKAINQANINATIMRNIKVPVPTLAEQRKFVSKIEALEKKIADAYTFINDAPVLKQAILQKLL